MKLVSRKSLLMLGVLSLTLGACSSAPKQVDILEQARQEYANASMDVPTNKHAPELLDQARDALQDADKRWKDKDELWRVEHFAYIARQRIETAKLVTESKETEREIQQLLGDRSRLTLQLREAELRRVTNEASKLKREMAALKAQQTERGMVLTLGDVLFDSGKATLTPASNRNIQKIAAFMSDYPARRAMIEGHTDSMGDDGFNVVLSRKRALSVRDALVNAGVESPRLTVKGLGETRPIDSNNTMAGRQANRRVEIIFPDSPDRAVQMSEADNY